LTAEFDTGQRFGAYMLGPVVGRGGMGVVYQAQHVHLGRTVALKLLAPELSRSEDFRARFLRESRLAAELDHPGIVTVYDAGEVNDVLFIAMRFVRGTDLAALIQQRGPLPPDETLSILHQVATALDAAHASGLVHRDVKPANVMIEGQRCYLADFGLTKRASSDSMQLTAAGQFLGTVDYVAPEQIEGRPTDGRADQYALGCVLFECLTGSRPYPRDSQVAIIFAQLREPPPRPCELRPDLPPAIDMVVAKAMAKDPIERYSTCAEFVAAAVAALSGLTSTAQREDPLRAPTAPTPHPGESGTVEGVAPAAGTGAGSPPSTPPATGAEGATGPAPSTAGITPAGDLPTAGRGEPGAGFPTAPLPPASDPNLPTAPLPAAAAPSQPPPAAPPPASQPPAAKRRRSPVLPLAALGLLIAAAVIVALVVSGGGSDEKAATPASPETPSQQPATDASAPSPAPTNGPHVVGTPAQVGEHPLGVVMRGDSIWVADSAAGSVTRVKIAGGAKTEIPVGDGPFDVASNDTSVWVGNAGSDTVTRIDVESGEASSQFPVGSNPMFLTAENTRIYVSNAGDNTVTVLDAQSGRQVGPKIAVGKEPQGITTGAGATWVANRGSDSVSQIVNGKVLNTIPVGHHPVGVVHSDDSIWVTNQSSDTVSRIRLPVGSARVTETKVGDGPYGIGFGEGGIWVTNRAEGTVTMIDPGSGKPVGAAIPVDAEPVSVAPRGGSVWVSSYADGTLSRIKP
jgi:YVTN family beta-propeller protein